jgi:hypothetical protein
MPNPPNDPYGWNAQNAQIAANRAQQAAAEQAAGRAYTTGLANQRGQAQQAPPSRGVPTAIKLVFLYALISIIIIFVLVIAGFFGAFSGGLSK